MELKTTAREKIQYLLSYSFELGIRAKNIFIAQSSKTLTNHEFLTHWGERCDTMRLREYRTDIDDSVIHTHIILRPKWGYTIQNTFAYKCYFVAKFYAAECKIPQYDNQIECVYHAISDRRSH